MERHEEHQYLDLVRACLDRGVPTADRTGTGTKALFGAAMRFSLRRNKLPLLTTKRTAYRAILAELLFFLRGQTDNRILASRGVGIWTANAAAAAAKANAAKADSSAFGPPPRPEHDLGPVYGFQWRHFGAPYRGCDGDYAGQGSDQLAAALESLRDRSQSSRRLVVSAWHPAQLGEMALPPCHCLFQFQRQGASLNCALYQRSADMGLGVPFNIASYATLTALTAKLAGLEPGEFVHFLGDYHVYNDHEAALREQLERTPFEFPELRIKERGQRRFEDFEEGDFEVVGYESHGSVQMKMSV